MVACIKRESGYSFPVIFPFLLRSLQFEQCLPGLLPTGQRHLECEPLIILGQVVNLEVADHHFRLFAGDSEHLVVRDFVQLPEGRFSPEHGSAQSEVLVERLLPELAGAAVRHVQLGVRGAVRHGVVVVEHAPQHRRRVALHDKGFWFGTSK